jgi:hypothetical protein
VKGAGCIYLAFGRPFLIQALNSIRTLRRTNPSVPVRILTNTFREAPGTLPDWDAAKDSWVFIEDEDNNNRYIKTDMLRYSSFERTLYLDCDTEVLGDLTTTFRFLDYWDIGVHLKEEGYSTQKEKGRQIVLDGLAAVHELPHWNGGVLMFAANPRVEEFFSLWNRYYREGLAKTRFDQVSLVEAAFRSSCRILSLDGRWNEGAAWGRARPEQRRYILHYTSDIDDRLAEQLIELDRLVYGESGASGAAGDDTVSFVRARQKFRERRQQQLNARRSLLGTVRQIARGVKRRLT